MQINYTGFIDLNTPLTQQAIDALRTNPRTTDYAIAAAKVNDKTIVYNDEMGYCYDEIVEIVHVLASLGYRLHGEVEYYGDYDGKIYIENNDVIDVDVTDIGLYEASDETLIHMLEARGYTVTKGRK